MHGPWPAEQQLWMSKNYIYISKGCEIVYLAHNLISQFLHACPPAGVWSECCRSQVLYVKHADQLPQTSHTLKQMGCNCFNPCSSVAASIPICIRTSRLHDLTTIGPPNFWRQVLNSYSKDSNPENMTTPNHHFVYNSDVISIISTGVYSHMCWWVPTHISTGWYDSERSYQEVALATWSTVFNFVIFE